MPKFTLIYLMLLFIIPIKLVVADRFIAKACTNDVSYSCGWGYSESDCSIDNCVAPSSSDVCWELFALYTATCSPGDTTDFTTVGVSNWSNDLTWGVDNCNYGGTCHSGYYQCQAGDEYLWAWMSWGFCAQDVWASGGSVRGYTILTDEGTAWNGIHTVYDTWSVSVKAQETDLEESEIYKKGYIEDYLAGTIYQPSAYLSAYQSIAYVKGDTIYSNTWSGHKALWEQVCSHVLCVDLSDWDDTSQMGATAGDEFTDGKCSYNCGTTSISSIVNSLDNGFPVIVTMEGESNEITGGDGTSWGYGTMDTYDLTMMVYGYVGNITNYLVYHPYHKRQEYTAAEFANWYKGYACRLTCDIDSDLDANNLNPYAYDTITLTPTAYYETGGVYEPIEGCWDWDDDDNYEDDFCYYSGVITDGACTACPNVGSTYDGTMISGDWDTSKTFQQNFTGSRTFAFTASASNENVGGDRGITFTEADATVAWQAPSIVANLQYAAGDYDDDVNDDGNLIKTYTIGFNISASTSTGPNNYTKIWGSIWNFTYTQSGVVDILYCITNYTNASNEWFNPIVWCIVECPGCTFINKEWNSIINHSYPYSANFTLSVRVVTVNWGPMPGSGWSNSNLLNFTYLNPSLIPRFDSVIYDGYNITDWTPPLTNPITFNLNKSVYNEDYIEWIVVDAEGDTFEDTCFARSVDAEQWAISNSSCCLDTCYIPNNLTDRDYLQLLPISLTAKSLSWGNIDYNVSVKMGTLLNVSEWSKQSYRFQSSTLIADIDLLDSDTGTWITNYGDTIWFDMNNSIRNVYPYPYIDIDNYDISMFDCYNGIWEYILSLFGIKKYCSIPLEYDIRDWNDSTILGVCYDYQNDGVYDDCISSFTNVAEGFWTGVNISAQCNGILNVDECYLSANPEDENWYMNGSRGLIYGDNILKGKICNMYGVCDVETHVYEFMPPIVYSSCYFTEDNITQVGFISDDGITHGEDASTYWGVPYIINVMNSSSDNGYYSLQFKLISEIVFNRDPWYEISETRVCDSFDSSICEEICDNFPYGCAAETGLPWSTNITDVYYSGDKVVFYFITIGSVWNGDPNTDELTICVISIFSPDITGCIGTSPYDDDTDDDFKVFINKSVTNATIGFNPNCSVISNPNYNYTINLTNASGRGNADLTRNTTYNPLGAVVTGACWDEDSDGDWEAYSGYVNCGPVSEGGLGDNISDYCGAPINWSGYWYEIYNITKNDTYETTVTLKLFDKCAATVVNSSKFAVWDKGTTPLLCHNGVLDDENGELFTSFDTSISDYGGECGTCSDGTLNNDEVESNYHGIGFDYGGKWCGYCNVGSDDQIWLAAVKEYGLIIPYDKGYCSDIEGSVGASAFLILLIILLGWLLAVTLIFIVGSWLIVFFTKKIVVSARILRMITAKKKLL